MKTKLAALGLSAVALAAFPAAASAAYWTGFHVGVQGGLFESKTDWRTTGFETPVAPADFDPATANLALNTSNFHIGGLAGYDYQVSSYLVLGAEAAIAKDFGDKTVSGIPGFNFYTPGVPHEDVIKSQTNWDASLVLKAGVPVMENTLLFVTAGVAFTERAFHLFCGQGPEGGCQPADPKPFDDVSDVLVGWTIGAGAETRLDSHWTARFSYRYADYGEDAKDFIAYAPDTIHTKLSTTTHAFDLALIYRF